MERKLGARGGRFGRDNGPLRTIALHVHNDYGDGETIYCTDVLLCGHTVSGTCAHAKHIERRRCYHCRASELAEAVLS